MSSAERKQQLKKFLYKFEQNPIILSEGSKPIGLMEQFLITYFGMCYTEGYRIIQKIQQNIFIMSLMEYQIGGNFGFYGPKPHIDKKHGLYRIICVQFNDKMNEDRSIRVQKYKRIKEIIQFFCDNSQPYCQGININFLFANNFTYSAVSGDMLQKYLPASAKNFYNRDYGIGLKDQKQGLRVPDERIQGSRLHQLIQLYLKGAGAIHNQRYLKKHVYEHYKFSYKLQKVINTILFIIGKQMIEGGYLTISSQKWMRKNSQKKFKKFDLLLRNQNKVCIIDWKFSKVNADEKIMTQQFAKKNKQYFQLARKQYNAEVQLKFYCFHQVYTANHHKFTTATYKYHIQNIQIDDRQYLVNQNNQIQIDSDSDSVQFFVKQNSKGKINNNIKNKNVGVNKIRGSNQIEIQSQDDQYSKVIFNKESQTIDFLAMRTKNKNKTCLQQRLIEITQDKRNFPQTIELQKNSPQKQIKNIQMQIQKRQKQKQKYMSPIQQQRRKQIQATIQKLNRSQQQQQLVQVISPIRNLNNINQIIQNSTQIKSSAQQTIEVHSMSPNRISEQIMIENRKNTNKGQQINQNPKKFIQIDQQQKIQNIIIPQNINIITEQKLNKSTVNNQLLQLSQHEQVMQKWANQVQQMLQQDQKNKKIGTKNIPQISEIQESINQKQNQGNNNQNEKCALNITLSNEIYEQIVISEQSQNQQDIQSENKMSKSHKQKKNSKCKSKSKNKKSKSKNKKQKKQQKLKKKHLKQMKDNNSSQNTKNKRKSQKNDTQIQNNIQIIQSSCSQVSVQQMITSKPSTRRLITNKLSQILKNNQSQIISIQRQIREQQAKNSQQIQRHFMFMTNQTQQQQQKIPQNLRANKNQIKEKKKNKQNNRIQQNNYLVID